MGNPSLQPAHAKVFSFERLFDPVFSAFPADAGFFHAAERCDFGRDEARVDADDAVFQGFGRAEDPADIAGAEIGGQAVSALSRPQYSL
jgi:hypothetical protein